MAAARDDGLASRADEVGEHGAALRLHDRAAGHAQDDVVAVRTVAVAALAGATVAGCCGAGRGGNSSSEVTLRVDDETHVAAVTAVAAVRTAERLELLAVHRGAAVAAVAAGDVQDDAVDERGHRARSLPYGVL